MQKHTDRILPFLLIPLLSTCAATPSYEVRNDKLEITGSKAYIQTCMGYAVEVKEGENWRTIKDEIPPDEGKPYYMNGKLESHPGIRMWCDMIQCVAYTPITVSQIQPTETVKTGIRQPGDIPEYETRAVKGAMKVTLSYFPNQKCEDKDKTTTVFLFSR